MTYRRDVLIPFIKAIESDDAHCEICNKIVYESSLLYVNGKFICLQCDDTHENEE